MPHRIITDRESFDVPRRIPAADAVESGRRPPPPRPDAHHAMDFEQARYNMVEQQIRTWEVLDQDVLDLLFTVRREEFVLPQYRALAFADLELPIGGGERMWAPKLEARVVHFPKSFLERYDQRPGQLIEVLTIALSQFLAQERQRASN